MKTGVKTANAIPLIHLASLLVELVLADMFDFRSLDLGASVADDALRDWWWDEAGDVDVVALRLDCCEEEGRCELTPERKRTV